MLATVAKVWPDYHEESTGVRRGHKNFPPARKLDPKTNYNKNNPSVKLLRVSSLSIEMF